MDLKKLLDIGYMLTCVDHFTNMSWFGFVPTKKKEGIVEFFVGTVVREVKEIQEGWACKDEDSEAKMLCVLERTEDTTKDSTETIWSTACEDWDFFEDVSALFVPMQSPRWLLT